MYGSQTQGLIYFKKRIASGGPPWAVKGVSLVTAPVGRNERIKIYKPRRDVADFLKQRNSMLYIQYKY